MENSCQNVTFIAEFTIRSDRLFDPVFGDEDMLLIYLNTLISLHLERIQK